LAQWKSAEKINENQKGPGYASFLAVSSPPAAEEIAAMGRKIESRQGRG
jgi:hypothetical protein